MEMTKKDYVDIIWDWAYDNLEFDTDNEVIYYTKSQKKDFIRSLYDNNWSKEDKKGRSIRIRIETQVHIRTWQRSWDIKKEDPLE